MIVWIETDLPWEDPAEQRVVWPPYPRPDTDDAERQELDGLTVKEAYNASRDVYDAYCREMGVVTSVSDRCYDSKAYTDPEDPAQKNKLLAHHERVRKIGAVETRIFETPPLLAWRAAFEEAKEAQRLLSFKNLLKVGMVFETEDGRRFLVGNMDKSGTEGGCCPSYSVENDMRIVRYCLLDLPANVIDE